MKKGGAINIINPSEKTCCRAVHPAASTAISTGVSKGAMTVLVGTEQGFQVGQEVVIDGGKDIQEINFITQLYRRLSEKDSSRRLGVGNQLGLQFPLKYNHQPGASIVAPSLSLIVTTTPGVAAPTQTPPVTSTPAAGVPTTTPAVGAPLRLVDGDVHSQKNKQKSSLNNAFGWLTWLGVGGSAGFVMLAVLRGYRKKAEQMRTLSKEYRSVSQDASYSGLVDSMSLVEEEALE